MVAHRTRNCRAPPGLAPHPELRCILLYLCWYLCILWHCDCSLAIELPRTHRISPHSCVHARSLRAESRYIIMRLSENLQVMGWRCPVWPWGYRPCPTSRAYTPFSPPTLLTPGCPLALSFSSSAAAPRPRVAGCRRRRHCWCHGTMELPMSRQRHPNRPDKVRMTGGTAPAAGTGTGATPAAPGM